MSTYMCTMCMSFMPMNVYEYIDERLSVFMGVYTLSLRPWMGKHAPRRRHQQLLTMGIYVPLCISIVVSSCYGYIWVYMGIYGYLSMFMGVMGVYGYPYVIGCL